MRAAPTPSLISNPWVLLLLFCGLLGPFALDFHLHYPDEIYYRDAAVKMLQTGDYLTTYLGSGELRFKKPILTYWAVLAGFKLFGVHALSSRIFFLLAGTATVGLTYLLGKTLFGDRRIAGTAALISASNPILIFAATRSIPDVLLVLTLTVSALGFAGLLRDGEQAKNKFLWMLYLGLGLAFEVKGLPAVALGGIGVLYLRFNPWQRISWKKLLYLPALLVALGIALFWFVAMWELHGPVFLASFLEDQVGTRVTSRVLLVLQNGTVASLLLVGMFLPWVALAIPKLKSTLATAWKENPQFFAFALLWGLAIVGMGALTSKFYERYLLPVAPVLALWLAWILVRGGGLERAKGLKVAAMFLLSLVALLVGVNAWILVTESSVQLKSFVFSEINWVFLTGSSRGLAVFYVGMGVLFLGYGLRTLLRSSVMPPKLLALSILFLFFQLSGITRLISLPHQGIQAKVAVEQLGVDAPIGFAGNLHVGSKIRMSLGPGYDLIDLSRENWKEEAKGYSYLILEDRLLSEWDTLGYTVQVASTDLASKAIPDFISASSSAERDKLREEQERRYYFLQKK
ncbi:MAG: phospholipid carrier-dependent glycosyltransferase [Bacteroidetes bacterium]|nr:phospholipid carrier-dependent glycosyltransferase [Bacteroidota bacterium]